MQVAMYYNNQDVRIEEIPKPKIGRGELLVKVKASGICGSDVMEWYRIKRAPLVLGHEITGEIMEVGEGITDYKIGERVFVAHHVPCNNCYYCLNGHHTACETLHTTNYDPGGFAEYIRVPQLNVKYGVFILPEEISFAEGTFIEPLACVIRGQRLAHLQAGQSVLILGSGISGLLHLLLARNSGAARIIMTDVNDYRLNLAKQLGADAVINGKEDVVAQLRKFNDNRLADLVIVCTNNLSAFIQSLQSVDRGGTVLFFAPTESGIKLPIPVENFWRNEITLMTSYANGPQDALAAIDLLRSSRIPVGKLITHRLSLDETGLGFQLMTESKESLKVIIEPHRPTSEPHVKIPC